MTPATCEELVQNVFVEACFSLKSYRGKAPFLCLVWSTKRIVDTIIIKDRIIIAHTFEFLVTLMDMAVML
jgi:hypothetical protein